MGGKVYITPKKICSKSLSFSSVLVTHAFLCWWCIVFMDVVSSVIDLDLRVKKLEDKNKEIMWVLERQHDILRTLGKDYSKRNNLDLKEMVEKIYG